MKKVIIVSTGGTIAMKYDPQTKGLIPAVTGEELIEAMPPLADLAQVELVEFANLPSPHITPKIMLDLRDKLDQLLESDEISGAVLTHGTDTLEETAYFLDLTLKTDKTVVVTGSMRSGDGISADGPINILSSVRTVIDDNSKGRGVLVVMNQQIHSAIDVTKSHTGNVNTFQSPFWGPLGYVDGDKVIWNRQIEKRERYEIEAIGETEVYLVKMTAGSGNLIIDSLVEENVGGIVLEGLGMGNVPPNIVPSIKKAIDKKIPLILNSRCLGGRPQDEYAYEGGGKELTNLGAVLAGDINGQKSRIKLIILVNSKGYKYEDLNKYFDK